MTNLNLADKHSTLDLELDKLISEHVAGQLQIDKKRNDDRSKSQVPGLQIMVSKSSEVWYSKTLGLSNQLEDQGTYKMGDLADNSVYDLGSLTKVILSAPLVYLLFQEGLLSYDFRVSRYIPSFSALGKERMTIGHLVSNTSGFPYSINMFRSLMPSIPKDSPELSRRVAQDKLLKELLKGRISNLPGKAYEESQIGYMVLAYVIEQVSGVPIDKMFKKITRSLGIQSLDFIDWEFLRREKFDPDLKVIVPTKFCPWRDRILHGECSDELAWYLSGVSSHSGLFGTLSDLSKIGIEYCKGYNCSSALFSGSGFKDKFEEVVLPQVNLKVPVFNFFGMNREGDWHGLDSDTGVSLWIQPQSELVLAFASTQIQVSKDLKPHKDLVRKIKALVSANI